MTVNFTEKTMSTNQKLAHTIHQKTIDKRSNVPVHPKQSQRKSVNQAEVSSAMAFLMGDALNQASSLLMAQSRAFFGSTSSKGDNKKSDGITLSAVNNDLTDNMSDSGSSDKLMLQNVPGKQAKLMDEQVKEHSSSEDYSQSLSNLYHKCKRAHEIILHFDEQGQHGSSGVCLSSSPHPNASITTPRSRHNTSGAVVGTMSKPPRTLDGSSKMHFRGKANDVAGTTTYTPKLQRVNSNISDTPKSSTHSTENSNPANPPEAVKNFLKKLNATGGAHEGVSDLSSVPTPIEKKRKGTLPPPDSHPSSRKKSRPPPPPSITNASCGSSNFDTAPSSAAKSPATGKRSSRSASKHTTLQTSTEVHGVGQSVLVKAKGTWCAAIVKDVNDDNTGHTVTYEVEFDNGEISTGVPPEDIRDDENE